MVHIKHLECLICEQTYLPNEVDYVCPKHGNAGILDVVYDYEAVAKSFAQMPLLNNRDNSIWRYAPLLPCEPNPLLKVGGTPLHDASRLADKLGLAKVWVKDDGRLPTGSFKDRASAIAVVKASESPQSKIQNPKSKIITTASTGNAAAALAGLCAVAGQANVIFVPASAPPAKIAQLLAYGATMMLVEGTYDDAFDLCLEAAAEFGWYNRNTAFNPYMTEGKKTVSFEIWEQLGNRAPDVVFVSVGDGCIIGGVHKGFKDLLALGWIEKIPRIMGVQSASSNYLAQAWENGEDVLTKPAISANTLADSISAGLPRDRLKAMAAVRETNGAYITVSDEVILGAIPTLAQGCGVFGEPAGAAAYAGLERAVELGLVSASDEIVVINTGSGLKDVKGAMGGVENAGILPHHIQPTLSAVKNALQR